MRSQTLKLATLAIVSVAFLGCKSGSSGDQTGLNIDPAFPIPASSAKTLVLDFSYLPIDPPVEVDLIAPPPPGRIVGRVTIDLTDGSAFVTAEGYPELSCTPSATTLAALNQFLSDASFAPIPDGPCASPLPYGTYGLTDWTFIFDGLAISGLDCPQKFSLSSEDTISLENAIEGYEVDCAPSGPVF